MTRATVTEASQASKDWNKLDNDHHTKPAYYATEHSVNIRPIVVFKWFTAWVQTSLLETVRKEFASNREHYPKTEGYVFNWRFNLTTELLSQSLYTVVLIQASLLAK